MGRFAADNSKCKEEQADRIQEGAADEASASSPEPKGSGLQLGDLCRSIVALQEMPNKSDADREKAAEFLKELAQAFC